MRHQNSDGQARCVPECEASPGPVRADMAYRDTKVTNIEGQRDGGEVTDDQDPFLGWEPEEDDLAIPDGDSDLVKSLDLGGAETLLDRLLTNGSESEWVEFKENNADPDMIGEYVSALSNSAALEGEPRGYLVWGVRDSDRSVVGTTFIPERAKKGAEDLLNWLLTQLKPQVHIRFRSTSRDGMALVILEIDAAQGQIVRFKSQAFIRVGTHKKLLKDHPNHERRLWDALAAKSVESSIVRPDLDLASALSLLDYPGYFELTRRPLPTNGVLVAEVLEQAGFITHTMANSWSVTALGALLLAKDLRAFPSLERKAVRVIEYSATNRLQTTQSMTGRRGYASGFRGLMGFVNAKLPRVEAIRTDGVREGQPTYPDLAVRELVANMLMHQDLALTGTGPMLEIFSDRLEFTNPGQPLIKPERFIDSPPRSRNEKLAGAMRTMGLCEEQGSGWDKITFQMEVHQLPPPLVEVTQDHTRVIVYGPRPLTKMERDDRVRAVYQHACLTYVSGEHMTNSSVRQRFGIATRNAAQATRLIKDAVDEGLVAPYDPSAGPRSMRYVPFWAELGRSSFN